MTAIPVLVAVLVLAAILRVVKTRPRKLLAVVAVAIWLIGPYAIAASGALRNFDARPPPFGVMLILMLVAGIGVALSPVGKRLAEETPLAWIIGLQAFRLPLELVMHQAAVDGVMPNVMSFSGSNFDIVTGVTALIVAPLAARGSRRLLWAWNVMGALLLANIMIIAVRATPIIAAFGPDALNTWVAYPPYVWLPAVLVVTALISHIVIFRSLSSSRPRTP